VSARCTGLRPICGDRQARRRVLWPIGRCDESVSPSIGPLDRTSPTPSVSPLTRGVAGISGRYVVAMVCMDVHNNPVNHVHRAGARSDQFDASLLLNQVEGLLLGHDPSRPGTGAEHADDVPRVGVIEPRAPGTVFKSVHGRLEGMA
jgi:hypothetical protein